MGATAHSQEVALIICLVGFPHIALNGRAFLLTGSSSFCGWQNLLVGEQGTASQCDMATCSSGDVGLTAGRWGH